MDEDECDCTDLVMALNNTRKFTYFWCPRCRLVLKLTDDEGDSFLY